MFWVWRYFQEFAHENEMWIHRFRPRFHSDLQAIHYRQPFKHLRPQHQPVDEQRIRRGCFPHGPQSPAGRCQVNRIGRNSLNGNCKNVAQTLQDTRWTKKSGYDVHVEFHHSKQWTVQPTQLPGQSYAQSTRSAASELWQVDHLRSNKPTLPVRLFRLFLLCQPTTCYSLVESSRSAWIWWRWTFNEVETTDCPVTTNIARFAAFPKQHPSMISNPSSQLR